MKDKEGMLKAIVGSALITIYVSRFMPLKEKKQFMREMGVKTEYELILILSRSREPIGIQENWEEK